jgi:lipopolysaccharide transport system ATP-binding protein
MTDTVIKVENLSKQYRIGAKEGYKTFRETLIDSAKAPFLLCKNIAKRLISPLPSAGGPEPKAEENTIWALKDVSFEVEQGEVVGIVGRNGAGKSTILKVLSKITEPTQGRVELRGRVGSLLEVGTGFHPELTGHENVYLYGAILGMDRWEVTRKFDEIIAFAELEKFIDTPVKRYSSGMYMRLAFAVAAHLEPEILLVDEVLAVGDAQFQKKCLGKMGDVSKEGRTVLFVSHNMNAISTLCTKGILLDCGDVKSQGAINDVVHAYMTNISASTTRGEKIFKPLSELPLSVTSVRTCDKLGNTSPELSRSDPVVVVINGEIRIPREDYIVAIDFRTVEDMLLFRTHSFEQEQSFGILGKPGSFSLKCTIPPNLFPAATYRLGIVTAVAGKDELQNYYPALEFDIVQTELLGNRFLGTKGILTPKCKWEQ